MIRITQRSEKNTGTHGYKPFRSKKEKPGTLKGTWLLFSSKYKST